MTRLMDLTGQRFGRLVVQERSPNRNGATMWKCVCDCGNEVIVGAYELKTGHTKSCGCLKKEMVVNDLTGMRFGILTAVKKAYKQNNTWMWFCKCDCGKEKIIRGTSLVAGNTKSCGCLQSDTVKIMLTKHSLSRHPLYRVYYGMMQRCENKNNHEYHNYGGRGISVCDEWRNDFKKFYDWSMENGYDTCKDENGKNILSIDRIDVNGDYTPDNCRWTTIDVQSNNKRYHRLLTYNGETHNLSEWSKLTGISRSAIYSRISRGWDIEKTLTTPMKQKLLP